MSPRIRCVLLCEDRRQEAFFRAFLEPQLGRRLDARIAPAGGGSAVAWVLKQFPVLVRRVVRIRPRENVALVMVVDGDRDGWKGRVASASAALSEAEERERQASEPICICVPTWHIETWLLWLLGEGTIDETEPLKERYERYLRTHRVDVSDLARKFSSGGDDELPSMSHARAELARLGRQGT